MHRLCTPLMWRRPKANRLASELPPSLPPNYSARGQWTKGYTAWIEDEHGKAVDEESLRKNEAVPSKPSVRERWQGLLVVFGSAMAALVILYAIGLWVDR